MIAAVVCYATRLSISPPRNTSVEDAISTGLRRMLSAFEAALASEIIGVALLEAQGFAMQLILVCAC